MKQKKVKVVLTEPVYSWLLLMSTKSMRTIEDHCKCILEDYTNQTMNEEPEQCTEDDMVVQGFKKE